MPVLRVPIRSYGRGILNIGNAFAAKGTTSLAGTTAVLAAADSALVTSAAMGDATTGAKLSATVLDAYRRAYTVNLGASFRQAPLAPRLGLALLGTGRPVNATLGNASLAFTTGQDPAHPLGWSDPLRLTPDDARAARVLAGRGRGAHRAARRGRLRLCPGRGFAGRAGAGRGSAGLPDRARRPR